MELSSALGKMEVMSFHVRSVLGKKAADIYTFYADD